MAATSSITRDPFKLTIWNPASLAALPTPDVRREIGDPRTPGLTLRITERGVKTFRFKAGRNVNAVTLAPFAHPRAPRSGRIGLGDAREWAADLREALLRGEPAMLALLAQRQASIAPVATVATVAGKTVREAFEEFYALRVAAGAERRRRPEELRADFERDILPALGAMPCAAVTEADCRAVVIAKVKGGAPVRAGKVLRLLQQFFLYARRNGFLNRPDGSKGASPAEDLVASDLGVEREAQRDRALSDAEIAALWAALGKTHTEPTEHRAGWRPSIQRHRGLSPTVGTALRFLLTTPVRTRSLLLAARSEIDLDAGLWTIPAAHLKRTTEQDRRQKGAPFVIPLSPLAAALVRRLYALGGERSRFVVTSPVNEVAGLDDKALCHALRRMFERGEVMLAGGACTPHDFRRTVRTGMARLGIDRDTAERCLGHAVGNVIERTYDTHAYTAEMRAALDKWCAHVDRLTAPAAANVVQMRRA